MIYLNIFVCRHHVKFVNPYRNNTKIAIFLSDIGITNYKLFYFPIKFQVKYATQDKNIRFFSLRKHADHYSYSITRRGSGVPEPSQCSTKKILSFGNMTDNLFQKINKNKLNIQAAIFIICKRVKSEFSWRHQQMDDTVVHFPRLNKFINKFLRQSERENPMKNSRKTETAINPPCFLWFPFRFDVNPLYFFMFMVSGKICT